MNPFVAVIWGVTLVGTVLVAVPNVVSWLMRTLGAARQIEQYTEEILAAGAGIAENTSKATALKDTLSLAPQLVAGAQSLESHAATMEQTLAASGRRPTQNPQEDQP